MNCVRVRWHTCTQKVCILSGIPNPSCGLLLGFRALCLQTWRCKASFNISANVFWTSTNSVKPQPLAIPGSLISSIIRRISRAPGVQLFTAISLFLRFICFSLTVSKAPPRLFATHYHYRPHRHADTNTRVHHERNMCFF